MKSKNACDNKHCQLAVTDFVTPIRRAKTNTCLSWFELCDYVVNHITMYIGKPYISTTMTIG